MLDIITLKVIRNIFDLECIHKLSAMTKIVYINSLIWHFEDKEPNHANLKGFDISRIKIKNYQKFANYYEEMQKAGLVIITEKNITFIDHWSKHIDKKRLERVNIEEYVAMSNLKPISDFEDELLNSQGLYEMAHIRNRLNKQSTESLLNVFIKEQKTVNKLYTNTGECIKHFLFWLPKNQDKLKHVTQPKTGNRILGLE